jgi:hypothetical protein
MARRLRSGSLERIASDSLRSCLRTRARQPPPPLLPLIFSARSSASSFSPRPVWRWAIFSSESPSRLEYDQDRCRRLSSPFARHLANHPGFRSSWDISKPPIQALIQRVGVPAATLPLSRRTATESFETAPLCTAFGFRSVTRTIGIRGGGRPPPHARRTRSSLVTPGRSDSLAVRQSRAEQSRPDQSRPEQSRCIPMFEGVTTIEPDLD